LAYVFDQIHASPSRRPQVPPFFIFTKAPLYGKRAVQFRGLAAPGANGVAPTDDLVAVWKSFAGQRFQNYRALFTILEAPRVPRVWLTDLQAGRTPSDSCPRQWRQWVDDGSYTPLVAAPAIETRTREEQLPHNDLEREILACVYNYFKSNPTAFEACAAALVQFQNPENYVIDEMTRRSVDGGRDAIGRYRLGPSADPITVDFALEAKCYRPELPGQTDIARQVGVKETARLISRLRHRQFGILVTTSYIGPQAYREIREDKHPVMLLCGRDLVNLLIEKGYTSVEAVGQWLRQFPR
jgi:Restriction endonuclease AspBHI N-terminal/Restriction endonuclease